MLNCLFMTVFGFLSGAVMYSYLFPYLLQKVDVREAGEDGNPGGMNAIAAVGTLQGIMCIVFDVLKAAVPVLISINYMRVGGYCLIPVIVAPVLGHAFSPFLRFKGGKAVAASFGSLLGAAGISTAFLVLVIATLIYRFLIVIKPNSSTMIASFFTMSLVVLVFEPLTEIKAAAVLIAVVVCSKHILNPNQGEFRMTICGYTFGREEQPKKSL